MAPAALKHSEKPQGWPAQSSNERVDPVVEMPQIHGIRMGYHHADTMGNNMGMEWESDDLCGTVEII